MRGGSTAAIVQFSSSLFSLLLFFLSKFLGTAVELVIHLGVKDFNTHSRWNVGGLEFVRNKVNVL